MARNIPEKRRLGNDRQKRPEVPPAFEFQGVIADATYTE
jgi:hypothetical protein